MIGIPTSTILNQEAFWGVYPIPEMKEHIGSYKSYDPVEGLFVFSSFNFPYLALYKRENMQEIISSKWIRPHQIV